MITIRMASKLSLSVILEGFTLIPIIYYEIVFVCFVIISIYNFLEFHFLHDVVFTLYRGSPVSLTYNSASEIYHGVASKCRYLHGRFDFPLIFPPSLIFIYIYLYTYGNRNFKITCFLHAMLCFFYIYVFHGNNIL